MALTVSIRKGLFNRRNAWFVNVVETLTAAATERAIDGGFPVDGTIVHYEATLTAGTGTTIQPQLARTAGVTTTSDVDHIGTQSSALARINDDTNMVYQNLPTGILYLVTTPNDATADHTITTDFIVVA